LTAGVQNQRISPHRFRANRDIGRIRLMHGMTGPPGDLFDDRYLAFLYSQDSKQAFIFMFPFL
jgi:hypothetical protein